MKNGTIEKIAKAMYGDVCGDDICGKCKMPECHYIVLAKMVYDKIVEPLEVGIKRLMNTMDEYSKMNKYCRERVKILERALELAIDFYNCTACIEDCHTCDFQKQRENCNRKQKARFIEKAEKEISNETV